MKVATSGKYAVNNVVTTNYMTDAIQNELNGKSLAQAQASGLIVADKFVDVSRTYSGNNGEQTFMWTEIVTDKGNAKLGTDLGNDLESWADNLGDLVFKVGHTEETADRPSVRFFRLQRPGGGIVEERVDSEIGQ